VLSDHDRRRLLEIARAAISARVRGEPYSPPPSEGALAERAGAFVSVHRGGELRGCIGYVEADRPLVEVVARSAAAAVSEDPRFPPVTEEELSQLTIEISVLSPLEPVDQVDTIEVGRHGLVVEDGWRRGLLLPQVATEWGWDRETFLDHTSLKAGLPADAWRRGARIYRFEAEVFGEPLAPGEARQG
jgi:AmmeMemoRadiSam system protein A